jgi:hypothetical protein
MTFSYLSNPIATLRDPELTEEDLRKLACIARRTRSGEAIVFTASNWVQQRTLSILSTLNTKTEIDKLKVILAAAQGKEITITFPTSMSIEEPEDAVTPDTLLAIITDDVEITAEHPGDCSYAISLKLQVTQ